MLQRDGRKSPTAVAAVGWIGFVAQHVGNVAEQRELVALGHLVGPATYLQQRTC